MSASTSTKDVNIAAVQLPLLPPSLLRSVPLTAAEWIRYFRTHGLFPGLSAGDIERAVPRTNPDDIEATYLLADIFHHRAALRLHTTLMARLRAKWAERSLDHAYVSYAVNSRTAGGKNVCHEYICPDARVERISQRFVELSGVFSIRRNGSSSIRKTVTLKSERRMLGHDGLRIVPRGPQARAA